MESQYDFVAAVQFMIFEGRSVPRMSTFISVHDPNVCYNVSTAYENHFLHPEIYDELHSMELEHLEKHLNRDIYSKMSEKSNARIACIDSATFHYLLPIMPKESVFYLGPSILGPHPYSNGPKPQHAIMARRIAIILNEFSKSK